MTETQRFRFQGNPVVSCRIEGENDAILYNPDTDNTILINGSGIAIWQFIQEPRSEEEIARYLSDFFDEKPESLLEDIRTFLDGLGEEYLRKEPHNEP